jgi:hypothetical protein
MNVKILIVAGLLGSVITTSDALAWSSGKHGHSGGGTSGQVFNSNNNTNSEGGSNYTGNNTPTNTNENNSVGVPEPSSLYALGSALALVGTAGWMLRRRK